MANNFNFNGVKDVPQIETAGQIGNAVEPASCGNEVVMRVVRYETFEDKKALEGLRIRVQLEVGRPVEGIFRGSVGRWLAVDPLTFGGDRRWLLERTIRQVIVVEAEDVQPSRRRKPGINGQMLRILNEARVRGRPSGVQNDR